MIQLFEKVRGEGNEKESAPVRLLDLLKGRLESPSRVRITNGGDKPLYIGFDEDVSPAYFFEKVAPGEHFDETALPSVWRDVHIHLDGSLSSIAVFVLKA